MFRLQPTSTLFPYTTLFRSCPPSGSHRIPGKSTPCCPAASNQARPISVFVLTEPKRVLYQSNLSNVSLDRKSTRLNSSHSQISYAVFCLKKKNHTTILIPEN